MQEYSQQYLRDGKCLFVGSTNGFCVYVGVIIVAWVCGFVNYLVVMKVKERFCVYVGVFEIVAGCRVPHHRLCVYSGFKSPLIFDGPTLVYCP